MKKITLILLALTVTASSFAFTTPTKKSPNAELHAEITKILNDAAIEFESEFIKADVTFTVTTKGELVVLAVESSHPELEGFIKGELNYKKVSFKSKRNGIVYRVPLKIVNKS